jgi:diguanylate cyclase (GGDEF)-like protein/PAS domain S-box-containing protein
MEYPTTQLLKTASVLFVDDSDVVRDTFAKILARRVGTLYVAADGEEGLRAYVTHKPDVVVTDIMMPVMDGLEMAAQIKRIDPHTPIIITTAFNEAEYLQNAINIGVDHYVVKPIQIDALLDAIAKSVVLNKANAQLLLSTTVFEASNDAIVVTDTANCIVAVNPAFTTITGYTSEEVIGHNPNLLTSGLQDAEFYRALWNSLDRDGRWQGEIWNRRKYGETYPEWLSISAVKNHAGEIRNYVAIFSDITERKQAEARVQFLAHYDALTELPNRILFADRLNQALLSAARNHAMLAVMFLDLDRFKLVNDSFGHAAGDLLLKEVARRLLRSVRASDTVSRQSGDEFVILLSDIGNHDDWANVAQKILHSASEPFHIEGNELHVGCSIGISLYPDDGADAGTLLKKADTAMYRAKHLGRNNYQPYHTDMHDESLNRLTLETNLRHAQKLHQFTLHYQPQLDIRTGQVIGMEALLRWELEGTGIIPANQFIQLAEETGLILPIGDWALAAAIAQTRAWQKEGIPPLRMAVNLSAKQFNQPNLDIKIGQLLEEAGLDPRYLEIEITESALMHDTERHIALLHKLKGLGISIAIDNFGTGYSSLALLKRLPVNTLKIDRSFVADAHRNAGDAAIVNAILALAESLSMQVVAEGIETPEQLQFLKLKHCHTVQGYYFSHPMTASDTEQWLRGRMPPSA